MKAKDSIRQQVWALLEKARVARFPGAQGRIPNFIGAEKCARLLSESPLWKKAQFIKGTSEQLLYKEGSRFFLVVFMMSYGFASLHRISFYSPRS